MRTIDRRTFLGASLLATGFSMSRALAEISWPLKVTMAKNASNQWEVILPGGSYLNTSGSQTDGLQEAIDHAVANGLGLEVIGGIDGPGGWNKNAINCQVTVRIPPIQHAYWDFIGCALVFNNIGASPGLFIDSVLHSNLNFRCVIVYNGTGAAIQIKPTANYHLGSGPLFVDNSIYIERVRVLGGGGGLATGLEINGSGGGGVHRSRIVFTEIEGDPTPTTAAMARGIHLRKGGDIAALEIRVNALLHPLLYGIDVENGEGNKFFAHIAPYGANSIGIKTEGKDNLYDVDITKGIHLPGAGALAAPGSAREKFLFRRNQGNPPFIDQSPDGKNRIL